METFLENHDHERLTDKYVGYPIKQGGSTQSRPFD